MTDPPAGATDAAGPVASGSWVAPDGSTVPQASSTTRRARRRRDPADRARAGLVGGIVLIALGGLFLVRQFIPSFDFDLWWPSLLIGLGILLVVVALVPGRHSS